MTDGVLEAVTWLDAGEADGIDDRGVVVAPGFVDLHVHFREPGNEDAETIATGLAAAAHGGFTTVCLMPNTTPALDDPAVLAADPRRPRSRPGRRCGRSPGARSRPGGRGETLAALGELADAGVVGFSDDGAGVGVRRAHPERARVRRARSGCRSSSTPRIATQTAGAEANDGFVATVLGLRGWPAAAEETAVARDLAILAEVVRDVPGARLHLTHLSTAGALDLVRRAKAAGLPVTCDVTPAPPGADRRVARRRAALGLGGDRRSVGRRDGRDRGRAVRVVAPGQSAAPLRRRTRPRAGRRCSTGPPTRSPRTTRRTRASTRTSSSGWRRTGSAGSRRRSGVVLAAVDAGLLPARAGARGC